MAFAGAAIRGFPEESFAEGASRNIHDADGPIPRRWPRRKYVSHRLMIKRVLPHTRHQDDCRFSQCNYRFVCQLRGDDKRRPGRTQFEQTHKVLVMRAFLSK